MRPEPHENRKKRHVGHDVGEEFRVLHLPRHDGLRHTGALQQADAFAELSQRHPVHGRRRGPRRRGRQFGKSLFLNGHHGDVVAEAARRVEHEKRKPAVAGDEP